MSSRYSKSMVPSGLKSSIVFLVLLFARLAAYSECDIAYADESTKQSPSLADDRRWSKIVVERQASEQALQTLRFEYAEQFRLGSKDRPEAEQSQVFEIAISGEKKSSRSKGQASGKQYQSASAFDGTVTRRRDSDQPGVLVVTRSRDFPVFDSRLPLQLIEYQPPAKIDSLFKMGQATLVAIKEEVVQGIDTVKITVQWKSGEGKDSTYRIEVWYDKGPGRLPVQTHVYDPHGKLETVIEDVRLKTIEVDDNRFSLPLTAKREAFDNGESVMLSQINVKEGSIQLNGEIPDDVFILKPEIGERVYNSDLGVDVVDPRKGLDLEGDTTGSAVPRPTPASAPSAPTTNTP